MSDNIYLFVPNLIGVPVTFTHRWGATVADLDLAALSRGCGDAAGYARIVLAAVAFYYVDDVSMFVWCYLLSAFLDVMDGYAARFLNQGTFRVPVCPIATPPT